MYLFIEKVQLQDFVARRKLSDTLVYEIEYLN